MSLTTAEHGLFNFGGMVVSETGVRALASGGEPEAAKTVEELDQAKRPIKTPDSPEQRLIYELYNTVNSFQQDTLRENLISAGAFIVEHS